MAQVKALIGNVKGPAGKDGSENQIYSYDETPIGTWVDGKPLYRKCFSYAHSGNNGGEVIANLTPYNIDSICDLYGGCLFIQDGNQFYTAIPVAWSKDYWIAPYVVKATKSLELNSNVACEGTIIVEYTKTTDTATT